MKTFGMFVMLVAAGHALMPEAGAEVYDRRKAPYFKSKPDEILKAAEGGDRFAQKRLGDLYAAGEGVETNHTEAVRWYRRSAEQDYAPARHNLGVAFLHGQGVPRNAVEAVRWFRLAAAQDFSDAQAALAACYENGWGVAADPRQAFQWYEKAAALGSPAAGKRVAMMLFEGKGVSRDYRAAEQRLLQLANGMPDDAEIQSVLGFIYYNGGDGVARDPARAAPRYYAAALRGHALSQHNLGLQHELGDGAERHPVGAYAWYLLAAAQGMQESLRGLGNLQRGMTPEQIREAEQIAAGFRPVAPAPDRPLLEVRNLRIEPAEVPRGTSYGFTMEFTAAQPRGEPKIPVEVGFRILQGPRILFESRRVRLMTENNGSTTYIRRGLPCRAPPGAYEFQVVLTDGTMQAETMVALVVR